MKPKIYLAGAVTGHDAESVRIKFENGQKQLEAKGYVVHNPVTALKSWNRYLAENDIEQVIGWQNEMRFSIIDLMGCEKIAMLPDWQTSKGAVLERDIAARLGIDIIYL